VEGCQVPWSVHLLSDSFTVGGSWRRKHPKNLLWVEGVIVIMMGAWTVVDSGKLLGGSLHHVRSLCWWLAFSGANL
jgi:hypothetical protein